MALTRRSKSIRKAIRLIDGVPDMGNKTSPTMLTAGKRPFAAPVYDPENSTMSPLEAQAKYAFDAVLWESQEQLYQYPEHLPEYSERSPAMQQSKRGERRRERVHENTPKRSRISTIGSALLNVQQVPDEGDRDLIRFYRQGPTPQPKMEVISLCSSDTEKDEDADEPPDGGTLAWLHTFAGFLVIFNAQ